MMIPLNCKLPDKGTVINSSRGGGGRHLQSWTEYIETTTKIQVELMNPQLRLRIGIF